MDPRFHPAQAALAAGDVGSLTTLLAAEPALATARSGRSHPTLLQCLVLSSPVVDTLEDLIDLLASRGAELTDPLIAAASGNNVRAVKKLLSLGANVNGNGRWSPLEEALYWHSSACVPILLEHGAAIANLRTAAGLGLMPEMARCFDSTGNLTAAAGEVAWPWFTQPLPEAVRRDPQQILANALVYAASWGRGEAVDLLLDRGASVNLIPAGFDYSGTPLHYAALNGHRDTVDQLLNRGADPAVRDTKIGTLPEGWAEHGGHRELAEHLRGLRPA